MKNIKEMVLNMPAWKGFVCVLLLMFSMSAIFEIVLSHTIFHMFDRILAKFEIENKEDIADMDDIKKHEQEDFCNKYKWLLEEKENLAKRKLINPNDDVNDGFVRSHEQDINFAIQHHQFDLKKCEAKLKSQLK